MDPVLATWGVKLTSRALSSLVSTSASMLVKKLLVAPTPGARLVDRPVRLGSLVPWRGGRREIAEKQIRQLLNKVLKRAIKEDPELGRLDPVERDAIVAVAARVLLSVEKIDMDVVQVAHLDVSALAALLREAAGEPAPVPADEVMAVADLLVDTACVHLVEFFTSRPEFVARTLVEQSRAMAELAARPTAEDEEARRCREFEDRLRAGLLKKLDKVQLFGLRLPPDEQTYQLTTAYVNLYIEHVSSRGSFGEPGYRAAATGTGFRLEELLARNKRIVLEGPAGAGKTTLLRRLAIHVLRGELPPQLAEWRGLFPFVLQLRNFLSEDGLRLPRAEQFVAAMSAVLGNEPEGWAAGLCSVGRALVLLDGVDEVPADHRTAVLDWIEELTEFYPDAFYVVTSRPAALSGGWRTRLNELRFSAARLEPLTKSQVDDFIVRWHQAVALGRTEVEEVAEHTEQLDECADALRSALLTRRDLARLATNPLLCAMLCALNRTSNRYLPSGRAALYDDALTMLLKRRDEEQRIVTGKLRLEREQMEPMLSGIAMWMTWEGRRTIPRAQALRVVEASLPRIRMPGGDERMLTKENVFTHLLERSGLLQETDCETLEFRHPSFQDYLSAVEIFQRNHLGHLLKNAHDPLYHDIAIMAAGQTQRDPERQERLLNGLIKRAEKDKANRRQLWLLAAACIADLGVVDPAVEKRIRCETERLLPPKDLAEVDEVARAGGFVIDLLAEARRARSFTAAESLATVRIGCLVSVDDALPLLRTFRGERHPLVISEIVSAWSRASSPEEYFDQVVSHLDLREATVPLSEPELIPFLERLPTLRQLAVLGGTQRDFEQLIGRARACENVRALDLSYANVHDLAGIAALENLEMLAGNPLINDLAPVAALKNLRTLVVDGAAVKSVTPLAELHNLKVLAFVGRWVPDLAPLEGLDVQILLPNGESITDVGDGLAYNMGGPDRGRWWQRRRPDR